MRSDTLPKLGAIFGEARLRNVPPCSIHAEDMLAIWALRIVDDDEDVAGATRFLKAHSR